MEDYHFSLIPVNEENKNLYKEYFDYQKFFIENIINEDAFEKINNIYNYGVKDDEIYEKYLKIFSILINEEKFKKKMGEALATIIQSIRYLDDHSCYGLRYLAVLRKNENILISMFVTKIVSNSYEHMYIVRNVFDIVNDDIRKLNGEEIVSKNLSMKLHAHCIFALKAHEIYFRPLSSMENIMSKYGIFIEHNEKKIFRLSSSECNAYPIYRHKIPINDQNKEKFFSFIRGYIEQTQQGGVNKYLKYLFKNQK
jgi:hypothetical protein